ncbi:DUF3224 domain-containing protein [Aquirhabdus parva]|uniref:DUF3224 family protein n=1 Tax=Aquirhabdus parva TaxID=2283318 RepID=A0A345P6S7_9GAMM|nr:DUF3224 domain-containing protein [Aquirhabdus parva]AXI02986.1 DUF3224 family protein [Aquirhabdus parva]
MTDQQATEPFEVKLNPEPISSTADGKALGRMSLDKAFHGDLKTTSQSEIVAPILSQRWND